MQEKPCKRFNETILLFCALQLKKKFTRFTSFDLLFQAIRDVCNVFIPFEEVF